MSVPSPPAGFARAAHAAGDSARMGREADPAAVDSSLLMTSIFPPRDADAHTRAAWLARSPWPEVVFATAL